MTIKGFIQKQGNTLCFSKIITVLGLLIAAGLCLQGYAQGRVKHHANGVSLQSVVYHLDSLRPCTPEQFFQKELQLSGHHRLLLTDSLPIGSNACRLTFQQYCGELPVIDARVSLLYSRGRLPCNRQVFNSFCFQTPA